MKLIRKMECIGLVAVFVCVFCLTGPMTALAAFSAPVLDMTAAGTGARTYATTTNLVRIAHAISGGGIDSATPINTSEDQARQDDAMKAIDNWTKQFQKQYKFGSVPGFSLGDINKFKAVTPLVVYLDGSSHLPDSTNAKCEQNYPGCNPPLTIYVRGTNYSNDPALQQSLYHETAHVIEYSKGDWSAPNSNVTAYAERNIEYMDHINDMLKEDLGRGFETRVQNSGSNFAARKEMWEKFVQKWDAATTRDTTYGPSPVPVDLNQLKEWYGFNVSRKDIENYYRSGQAGQAFVDFFKEYDQAAAPTATQNTTGQNKQVLTYQHPVITVDGVDVGKVTKTIGVSNTLSWKVEADGDEAICSAPNTSP